MENVCNNVKIHSEGVFQNNRK